MRALQIICLSALAIGVASADPLTGSYTIGDGSDGNQATGSGPWHLTATNDTFSYVEFTPDQSVTFGQLNSLFADFVSNSGGSGGGTPRMSVGLQDGANENFLHIYFGDSPSFTDSDAVLNTWSNVNLIGNNDPGRYDTSNFAGGSPSTTYSSALALVGGLHIDELDFVVDTFGDFQSRDETLNAMGGSFTPVPEPSELLLLGPGLAGLMLMKRKIRAR